MHKKTNRSIQNWQSKQKDLEENFHKDLKEFRRLIKIWRDKELSIKKDSSEKAVLIQYAQCVEQVNNHDRLKGLFFVKDILYKENMKDIKDQKEILMGFPFLDQKDWKINFGKNFIKKLKFLSEGLINRIFFNLYAAGQGFIHFTQGKKNTFKAYQRVSQFQLRYYTLQMEVENDIHYLLVSVGPHRVPNFNFNNVNGSKIEYFQYLMMITAEDLIDQSGFQDQANLQMTLDNIESFYEENPRMNYHRKELIPEKQKDQKLFYYRMECRENFQLGTKIFPTRYKTKKLDQLDLIDYEFLLEKFNDYQLRMLYLQRQDRNKEKLQKSVLPEHINESKIEQKRMIKNYELQSAKNKKFEFKNLEPLIRSIQSIPNFKFPLTNQQRNAISENGNLIIVGRSGTGKTTCGMLRLYGIECFIKRKEFRQNKIQITNQKCKLMLMDSIKPMKNVFLTFSDKLIDQIEKQYNDVIFQIKSQHFKTCSICRRNLQAQRQDQQKEDIFDRLQRLQRQKQEKVVSLDLISNQEFPGFYTIYNFIRIIDKSILNPFFSRKKEHQEKSNTKKIIKYAFINRYKYTADNIIHTETVEAVYVDYDFFFNHVWSNLPGQLTKPSKEFYLFTPAIVWAQIFSILKGSLKAYLCPQGYISFKMYLEESQSIFQRQSPQKMYEYKKKVYNILKSYINYCRNQRNAYDLMDVVNHNLRQIQLYGYSGPKMNYMFVDEVQDLTAATTFLISKMATNDIFYCGDTAQAIIKGVSFRFQDLKFIFNKQYCKNAIEMTPPKDILQLTVNFRSHHLILQLADVVVGSINSLFPDSIIKTKRQQSYGKVGPKPFILLNKSVDMLYQLICGPRNQQNQQQQQNQYLRLRDLLYKSNKKQQQNRKKPDKKRKKQQMMDSDDFDQSSDEQEIRQTRRFNYQQIIIVRNKKEKAKLPKSLRRQICFIPQTVKGLQYDQVIFFNFFSSCHLFDKWEALLSHLDPDWTYKDKQAFEKQLRQRIKQEGLTVQITDQLRKILGYDSDKNRYNIWNLKVKETLKGINIDLFLQIGTELKILYTAITRARSSFTIFDKKIPKKLLDLWQFFKFVTMVDETNVLECFRERSQYIETERHIRYHNPQQHWFDAGVQMLERKDYENAKKCFKNIGRIDLVDRILARELQIKAQNQLQRINIGLKNLEKLTRMQRKIFKIKLQKQQKQVHKYYISAGTIYKTYSRLKDAAEAFFKGQDYKSALEIYKQIKNQEKVAICCKKLKNYKLAIEIFKQSNDVQSLIECYIQLKDWQQLYRLIIQNQEYINKIDKLQDVTLECIRQIIKSHLKSQSVANAQKYYNEWNRLTMQEQINNKKIYCEGQFSSQVQLIILSYQKQNIEKIIAGLTSKVDQLQTLKKQEQQIKDRLYQLHQQGTTINLIRQAVRASKSEIKRKLDDIQDKIEVCQSMYLTQQLGQDQQYLGLNNQLQQLYNQKNLINVQNQQLQQNFRFIQMQIIDLQEKYQQVCKKFDILSQRYNFQNLKLTINKLKQRQKRLNHKQSLSNTNSLLNPQPGSVRESDIDDQINQMRSVTDLSEMRQIWGEDDSRIGGLNLFPDDKNELLNQIIIILNLSSNILENIIDKQYDTYHHKYIQQKLIRNLKHQSTSNYINYLIKLVMLQQNKSSLLLCDIRKEFTCLSPKFILGYLLEYSHNFASNRHFKEERYQFVIKQQQDQRLNNYQVQLNQVQKVLASLNIGGLKHKIPRLAFQKMFYSESILQNIMFGLLLQGHFNEVLMFCKHGTACKLAYLYSNYGKLVNTIHNIAQNLNITNLRKDQFLFITDQRVYRNYPEASVLNIFTIQNLFYLYDQCQDNPFLSKRVSLQKFDIEQVLINDYVNFGVSQRIEKMKRDKEVCSYQINRLTAQNYELRRLIDTNIKQMKVLQKIYELKYKQYAKQIQELQKTLIEQQDLMDNLKTKRQIAILIRTAKTIPKKQKERYEKTIQCLIFKRAQAEGLGNNIEVMRLQNQITNVEEQYKQLRQEHEKAVQNLKDLDVRIEQKQKSISVIKQRLQEIQISIQQQSIYLQNPQQWKQYYLEYIKYNQQLIRQQKAKIPRQLEIFNKQELKQVVLNILIREQQQQRYNDSHKKIKKHNLQKMQKQCHIPKIPCYKFINKYIKGQLSQNSQDDTRLKYQNFRQIYYQILVDAKHLQQLESRQYLQAERYIIDVKICNIVIFYLSYIFNKTMRMNIDDSIRIASYQYAQNQKKRSDLEIYIRQLRSNIEYCDYQLWKTKNNRKYQKNVKQRQNLLAQLNQQQKILRQIQGFSLNPVNLFLQFFDNMQKKIKNLQLSRIYFMEILFGFFQCRIIRQCQLLDFLSNEYVLVRQSSIVVEKLLKQGRYNIFAYYFDQENQTILCRFEDIQRIISGFILQKHHEIVQMSNMRPNKDKNQGKFKGYINKQIFGYVKRAQNAEDKSMLSVTQSCSNPRYYHDINALYDVYLNNPYIRQIKDAKQRILQYYLRNSHQNTDAFFFVYHQLRQYYFLEKTILNMKEFNFTLLQEIRQKKTKLKAEYQNYTRI